MKPPSNNNNDRRASYILQTIRTDSRVYLRRLPGLEPRYLATLGCQILSVHKLPAKLIKVLNESCNGVPGFCEQILFDLLRKDKIYVVETTDTDDQDANLTEGDADKLLVNLPSNNSLFQSLFSRRKQSLSEKQRQSKIFSRICLLRDPTSNDVISLCQQNFQNYIMCRIDRLSEGEIFLIKTAAVIGNTFSRTFLWQLVDSNSKKSININSCILDMMQRSVIECAYQQQQNPKRRSIQCACLHNPTNFPSQCRLMAFTHVSIREGIYNSLTDSLKRSITRNAIDYLEKQCTIVCSTCGPRNDIPFFVRKQDGLTKVIKTSQQHGFVDIVKLAALREIDNAIKQSIRFGAAHAQRKPRSNTSSNPPPEPITAPAGNSNTTAQNSLAKVLEKRRNSIDASGFNACRARQRLSLLITPVDENKSETKVEQNGESLPLSDAHSNNNNNNNDSPLMPTSAHWPLTSPKSNPLISLIKFPKSRLRKSSLSNHRLLKTIDELIIPDKNNRKEVIVERPRKRRASRSQRVRSFFHYIFCQTVPSHSSALSTEDINNQSMDHKTPNAKTISKSDSISQEAKLLRKQSSHWQTVRQVLIPCPNKVLRACPSDQELLEQPMFSPECMLNVVNDLNCLNRQIYQTRTFQNLYDQSFRFHNFQSYVQYRALIHYVHDAQQREPEEPNLNKFINEFVTYNDLRICECPDYVFAVYTKLLEYHTNLYEKLVDELRSDQFDRIMYYRIEICNLLLRSNCLQRLLVEIENGRKLCSQFQRDTLNQDTCTYKYQYYLTKYTYNLFEAIVLQATRAISDAKLLCEESLGELNEFRESQTWEEAKSMGNVLDPSSAKDRRLQYEQSRDILSSFSHTSQTSYIDPLSPFVDKYRLEYLICQYYLLQYQLSRHQSSEARNTLINSNYHIYPVSFSLPCTIILIEYFYCEMNYNQCSILMNNLIRFWWNYVTPREKLELGKLISLSLVILLKQSSLEPAILSGYFSKRILTGYHENIFLIETCIHLTIALIGEMRISNIELILQHLEYLSEQTMNSYAKLWYYTLVVDVAIELGYELMPITADFLENVSKYRRKLLTGPHQRSLLIVYSDCTLAQIYIRLGDMNMSKIHFQQALHQIKYDQMHLSNVDFRFKRALLKLIETQLLHWYHTKESEETITKECFLLTVIENHVNDELIPWNRTRYFIYQAYYDRLINDYKRAQKYSIDNDFQWELSLQQAENQAIKLDLLWIKRLRAAWILPVSEQISLEVNQCLPIGRSRRSTVMQKPPNRFFLRPSMPHIKFSPKVERNVDEQLTKSVHTYSHQNFVDWRLFIPKTSLTQFQLYVLPVCV
ncbi:unnamed protein product [Adineta ricciae]|uniref:Uncharacterized protein n=1 Tax=Adineta ricciae TaxID=249248 RepID=A0A816DK54_ADIRI|nr:unnamed protein product [Adineta ricciae]